MAHFPCVKRLLDSGKFAANHFAANLSLDDPIVPALEYFLSLEHVDGFSEKFHELRTKPVGTGHTNNPRVQWASMCAELGAIHLLGCALGVPLVGFDKPSPKALRLHSNCDIVASINDRLVHVEVKRNAKEDSQMLPELLDDRLQELGAELDAGITGELLDRRYDCSDIEARLIQVRQHVETQRATTHGLQPSIISLGAFRVHLSDGDFPMQFYTPLSLNEVRKKLLGPGGIGRDGEPMQPLVPQAIDKGADYLFLRIPRVESAEWGEIVQGLFLNQAYKLRCDRLYVTSDQALQGLCGIVLFARYDDFCIVGTSEAEAAMWIPYAIEKGRIDA